MEYKYQKIISKCPLCSNKDNLLLYEINSELVTKYLISRKDLKKFKELKRDIEELWGGENCKKIICKNCLLVYAYPFVGGNNEFYSNIYSSPNKYPNWRWDYDVTLNEITKLPKGSRKSLLEIGAGNGAFLKIIPPEVIAKKNIFSCEISESGKEELSKYGIKNYDNIVLNKVDKKFSIICLFDTLEHLDNLDALFKKIKKISAKNAHIFITTHIKETVKFLENRGAGIDLPPVHISCWDRKSFETLSKRYGLKIVERKLNEWSFFRKVLNFGLGTFETRKLRRGTLEDKIDNRKNKMFRKTLIFAYLFMGAIYFFINVFTKKLYSTQWIHLKNIKK